jgi:hypothetical protein
MARINQDFVMTQGEDMTLRWEMDSGDITDITGFTVDFRFAEKRGNSALFNKAGAIFQTTSPPIPEVVLVPADTSPYFGGFEYTLDIYDAMSKKTEIASGHITIKRKIN